MSHSLKTAAQGAPHKGLLGAQHWRLQRRVLVMIALACAFHVLRLQAESGAFDAVGQALGGALQVLQTMGAMLH